MIRPVDTRLLSPRGVRRLLELCEGRVIDGIQWLEPVVSWIYVETTLNHDEMTSAFCEVANQDDAPASRQDS